MTDSSETHSDRDFIEWGRTVTALLFAAAAFGLLFQVEGFNAFPWTIAGAVSFGTIARREGTRR